MRPPIVVLCLCLAGSILLSSLFFRSAAPIAANPEPGDGVTAALSANSRLGIVHISAVNAQSATYSPRRYQRANEAYANWNRWVFYWHEIEASNNSYNYGPQEMVATADVSSGLQTEGILMGTPGWCTTASMSAASVPAPPPRVGQTRYGNYQLTATVEAYNAPSPATYPPANLDAPVFSNGSDNPSGATGINRNNHWADFVFETVSRFKNRIKHWEVWNEPDYYPSASSGWFGFWCGSPEQYYRLLKVGYLAAKYADPQATIIIGGMAYWPDSDHDFMPRVLDAANADSTAPANNHYFNAVAYHWYNRSSQMYYKVNETRNMMAQKGFGSKPYWVNESGSPAWNDPAKPPFGGPNKKYFGSSTMTEQASYVIQAIAYGLAAGVDKMLMFQLYDDGNAEAFGLLRNDDSARPQYAAYQQAATYFRDITSISLSSQGTAHIVTAYTSTNKRVIAMWNNSPNSMTASIQARASSATLVTQPTETSPNGSSQTIYPSNGYYRVPLPGATCRLQDGSEDYIIGGLTYILVESGVGGPTPTPSPTPTPGPIATGLVNNGNFEQTPVFTGWTISGSTVPQLTASAHNGSWAAILGKDFQADSNPDLRGGGNSTISQSITLPAQAPKLNLDFYVATTTTQSYPSNPLDKYTYDFFEVLLIDASGNRHDLYHYIPASGSTTWQRQSIDLTPWRGQTVWLTFNLWQSSAEYPTTATIDVVSIWPYKTFLPLIQRNAGS